MQSFITDIMSEWGYFGTFLLIAAENLFPPIPSEVILTFAGFLTTATRLSMLGMVFYSTLGSLFGAVVLYAAGRQLNEERVLAFANSRVGRALRFEAADIEKARVGFTKNGAISVLLFRCVPIVRSLISIPAGMAKMPFVPFVLLTALGSAAWNTILIFLGAFAGANWQKVTEGFSSMSGGIKLILLSALVLAVFLLWKNKHKAATH